MIKTNSRKVLNDFCESTSLHGYNHWYNADSLILKVAWTFVILAATCLGATFLVNQTKEYFDGTILTTIETSSALLDVSIGLDTFKKSELLPIMIKISYLYSIFKIRGTASKYKITLPCELLNCV